MSRSGGIYGASRTRHAPMWLALRSAGAPIISTWIDKGIVDGAEKPALWRACVDEAAACDFLIVYVAPGDPTVGALVEMGAALAGGARILWVGDVTCSAVHHERVELCASLEAAVAIAMGASGVAKMLIDGRLLPAETTDGVCCIVRAIAGRMM